MAHTHSHSDTHGHSHGIGNYTQDLTKYNLSFAIAVFLNLGFCIVEAIYAIAANSMGLLADAGHNFADVLGLMMAWGANWLLTRNASAKYSYGFKKTTILAALSNALLLVIGSALIAYESINKLLHPVAVDETTVIVVALVGIFINGGTALLFLKGRNEDLNIKGAFLHLAWDAVIAFGVVVSGIAIYYTQWLWLDPMVGLSIVLAILIGTWGLLRDSVNLILDAVPHNVDQVKVKNYLQSIQGVQDVHDLHIWGLSTQEIALTAHFVMPNGTLSDHAHEEINHHLKANFNIRHVTIQVENGHLQDPCGQVIKC